MRQNNDMPRQERLQQAIADDCADAAETLTVTRPALMGGAALAQNLPCLPQSLRPFRADQMTREGNLNVGEERPHWFVFPGHPDVQEGDEIAYDGQTWEVITVVPERYGGVTLTLNCTALRRKRG